MNKFDCAIGFLLGISAGAAIGLLLAPQSGIDARRTLVAKAQESADRVVDAANAMVDAGLADLARKQEGLKNAVEAGKKAYDYTTA